MTRRLFGGKSAVQDELGNVFSNQTNVGNAWTAQSGGSAVVDLQTPAGAAITSASTDEHGLFFIYGPDDGTAKLWMDFGFGRFEVEANDTTDRLAVIEADYLTSQNIGDIGGFAPVDGLGFVVDLAIPSAIPYYARQVSNVWQPRSFYTTNALRTVVWVDQTSPAISSTYALAGTDMWLDGFGELWLADLDGTWHGGGTGGGGGVSVSANLRTLSTMGVTGLSGGVSTGVLFGASPGLADAGQTGAYRMSSMVTVFGPQYIRTYDKGVPSAFGNTSQGQWVPAGIPQMYSCKPDTITLSNSSSAGYSALVASLRTLFGGMPDIPGQRGCVHHEPENDGTAYTPAQWAQSQINFHNDVIVYVNTHGRTNPILHNACLMAFSLSSGSGRNVNSWLTPGVLAVIDEIGWDLYNLAYISLAANFAANAGLPWSIPEFGSSSSSSGTSPTDAQSKAFMTASVPGLRTMSNGPTMVCWFNGNNSQLCTDQTAASSASATTVPLDNLAITIPSGSAVRVGVGTANVDATTTNASSTAPTLHVPALAHSHAAHDAVELFPQSCAQWKVYCT